MREQPHDERYRRAAMPLDWHHRNLMSRCDTQTREPVSALQPGEIILMLCSSNPTDHTTLAADALGRIIQAIHARGYTFVTLDTMFS